MAGILYLVGTPIGNLKDVSERARETLARADLVACEDTRRTGKLLAHLGIRGDLVSFFEGNERRRVPTILEALRAGKDVALVTDGGMPGISDPGYRLVRACIDEGIPVDVVPGPSAVLSALVISGLPTDRFAFEGFAPRKAEARRARLAEVARDPRTLVFFESPNRVRGFLEDARKALGERRAAVVRELTKMHQEVLRGTLAGLAEEMAEGVRGEVTVVIEGARPEEPDVEALAARVNALVAEGLPRKEAVARVAEESGAPKSALYDASLPRG